MRNGKSYIKESSDISNKIKSMHSLPGDVIIAKVDVLGLYLFTPYKAGLKALKTLEKIDIQKVSTDDINSTDVKIVGFFLKICFSIFFFFQITISTYDCDT